MFVAESSFFFLFCCTEITCQSNITDGTLTSSQSPFLPPYMMSYVYQNLTAWKHKPLCALNVCRLFASIFWDVVVSLPLHEFEEREREQITHLQRKLWSHSHLIKIKMLVMFRLMHKLGTMLYFAIVILFSLKQLRFWSDKVIVVRCLNELNDCVIHFKNKQSISLLAFFPGCHTKLMVTPWSWNVIVTEAASLPKRHKLTL